jgi:hypothetical protein
LEKDTENFIKIDFFRKEHEDYQERIRDYVMIQMGNIQENLTQHRDEQVKTVNVFEEHIEKIKKETLWKITDCEDIIKTRISEQQANSLIESLGNKLSLKIRDTEQKLLERNMNSYKELSQRFDQL